MCQYEYMQKNIISISFEKKKKEKCFRGVVSISERSVFTIGIRNLVVFEATI